MLSVTAVQVIHGNYLLKNLLLHTITYTSEENFNTADEFVYIPYSLYAYIVQMKG